MTDNTTLGNLYLNRFAPHLSKFFAASDLEAAQEEVRRNPGSIITKIMNYSDSHIEQLLSEEVKDESGKVIKKSKVVGVRVKNEGRKYLIGYLVQYAEALATGKAKAAIVERNKRLHREYTFTRTQVGKR